MSYGGACVGCGALFSGACNECGRFVCLECSERPSLLGFVCCCDIDATAADYDAADHTSRDAGDE